MLASGKVLACGTKGNEWGRRRPRHPLSAVQRRMWEPGLRQLWDRRWSSPGIAPTTRRTIPSAPTGIDSSNRIYLGGNSRYQQQWLHGSDRHALDPGGHARQRLTEAEPVTSTKPPLLGVQEPPQAAWCLDPATGTIYTDLWYQTGIFKVNYYKFDSTGTQVTFGLRHERHLPMDGRWLD
ncbi:MAG: hypothetical protein M0C28_06160 [Candidatus Moduliflexus flocculans]|nr:hypothetical protein [Candidatus Moduliflexus flocculans]